MCEKSPFEGTGGDGTTFETRTLGPKLRQEGKASCKEGKEVRSVLVDGHEIESTFEIKDEVDGSRDGTGANGSVQDVGSVVEILGTADESATTYGKVPRFARLVQPDGKERGTRLTSRFPTRLQELPQLPPYSRRNTGPPSPRWLASWSCANQPVTRVAHRQGA